MIEPVVESLVQLLVQSILVYIVLGPSDSGNIGQQSLMMDDKCTKQINLQKISAPPTIDISSMLFESTTERFLYVVLLASSFFSVCITFTKYEITNNCLLPT